MKPILTLKKQNNFNKFNFLLTEILFWTTIAIGGLIYGGQPYLVNALLIFLVAISYFFYLTKLYDNIIDSIEKCYEIEIFQDTIRINQKNLLNIRDIYFDVPFYAMGYYPQYDFGTIKDHTGKELFKIYFSVNRYIIKECVIFDISAQKLKQLIDDLKFRIETDDKAHEMIAKLKLRKVKE
ncbi:MAG: hypothetical protein JW802_00300 [Campylobacterales bacterium]|nr:hypothetical protein [Campylobacterales bacterium]MBN2832727.1 hypothetical protein [Campylobacterales bacterium]